MTWLVPLGTYFMNSTCSIWAWSQNTFTVTARTPTIFLAGVGTGGRRKCPVEVWVGALAAAAKTGKIAPADLTCSKSNIIPNISVYKVISSLYTGPDINIRRFRSKISSFTTNKCIFANFLPEFRGGGPRRLARKFPTNSAALGSGGRRIAGVRAVTVKLL